MKYIAIDSKGRVFYFHNRQLKVKALDDPLYAMNVLKDEAEYANQSIKIISFATGKAKDTIIKAAQEIGHFVYFPSSKEIEKFKLFKALKTEMSKWYSAQQPKPIAKCGNCGKPCNESGLCVECSTPSSDAFAPKRDALGRFTR